MIDGFLTEMVIRKTTTWYEERHPTGPTVAGVHPYQLQQGNWFVHLKVTRDRPVIHVLVRMRGMSVEGFDTVQADDTICPACRAGA